MLAWPGLVRSSVSVGTPRRSRSLRSNATSNLRGFALLFRALVLRGKNRGERRERAALRGLCGCGIVEPSRTTADVIHETGDKVFRKGAERWVCTRYHYKERSRLIWRHPMRLAHGCGEDACG